MTLLVNSVQVNVDDAEVLEIEDEGFVLPDCVLPTIETILSTALSSAYIIRSCKGGFALAGSGFFSGAPEFYDVKILE